MSNEKANEFLSWRGRLTPPDALPEQGLEEKEETWRRLAERLQKNPRRRFAAWWIAAACLVLAFLPVSHLFRTRPAHSPRIALHPIARHPATPLRKNLREPLTVAVAATVVKTLPPAGHRSIPASNYGEFAIIKKPLPGLLPSPADTARITHPDTMRIGPAAPLLAAVVPPPPQAAPRLQLRIVYQNELNTDPFPALANRPPAPLRLGTAANTADWTANQQNTALIKIDLSSHNH